MFSGKENKYDQLVFILLIPRVCVSCSYVLKQKQYGTKLEQVPFKCCVYVFVWFSVVSCFYDHMITFKRKKLKGSDSQMQHVKRSAWNLKSF